MLLRKEEQRNLWPSQVERKAGVRPVLIMSEFFQIRSSSPVLAKCCSKDVNLWNFIPCKKTASLRKPIKKNNSFFWRNGLPVKFIQVEFFFLRHVASGTRDSSESKKKYFAFSVTTFLRFASQMHKTNEIYLLCNALTVELQGIETKMCTMPFISIKYLATQGFTAHTKNSKQIFEMEVLKLDSIGKKCC